MKVLGVTGGIGSGKSAVSEILQRNGGCILDADKMNHALMLKGNAAYNEITACFGNGILTADDEIDRKALAHLVFDNRQKLDLLVKITHKHVVDLTRSKIQEIKAHPEDYRFIVIDAPLLVEAELHTSCDYLIVLYVPMEVRIKRIIARDGITEEDVRKRIAGQMSFEELKEYADFIIDNGNGFDQLEAQVLKVLKKTGIKE